MASQFSDRLIERALSQQSRVIVGLDPNMDRFPAFLQTQLRQDPTEENGGPCKTVQVA